jgi:transcriptional regulator with XRE-family HTH domain
MSKSLAASFARELKAARHARGWTQAELAERVGIAIEVCGRLERGATLPRADTLVRLAEALGVSTDLLLGRTSRRAGDAGHTPAAGEPDVEYADSPEMRRLLRRLEGESPRTLRLLEAFISSLQVTRRRRGRAV